MKQVVSSFPLYATIAHLPTPAPNPQYLCRAAFPITSFCIALFTFPVLSYLVFSLVLIPGSCDSTSFHAGSLRHPLRRVQHSYHVTAPVAFRDTHSFLRTQAALWAYFRAGHISFSEADIATPTFKTRTALYFRQTIFNKHPRAGRPVRKNLPG